jgi:recombination protein RecT
MAKKSVIGRACKLFISSSDDSTLALAERVSGKKEHEIEDADAEELEIQKEIQENANKEDIDFEKELTENELPPEPEKRPEPEEKKERQLHFQADF